MENLVKAFLILLFICSCNKQDYQTVSPEIIYKRDMILEVNGVKGIGTLVAPSGDSIPFHVTAMGDLDLFTFTTCHREEATEDASNVTETSGWVFKRTIKLKREVEFDYAPTALESEGGCPVFLGGYAEQSGRHSWGLVDFETADAKLPATLLCNGETIFSKGVSICQAKTELIQSIKFEEVVRVIPSPECDIPLKIGTYFEFPIHRGQCVYAFKSNDGKIHRLTTLGYDQILIRK